jgi:hypothetical protein
MFKIASLGIEDSPELAPESFNPADIPPPCEARLLPQPGIRLVRRETCTVKPVYRPIPPIP